ncbi:carbon-nitrogen hydrolase [Halalkalibacillus sediminis]|uniref:Carbon-nitrogen hydrolase n=1 Tax=Halalkalibacillus sediminis TaxID=2018042 RepID=A0A2I0QUD6_9BACI|nr:carbon-nitrogen family hydrolase [Halalkalibacillus sediminis]PKR77936.1 carbon-nitrogen hydrolase [Halalkalibacillus sediminis]
MKFSIYQMDIVPGDPKSNRENVKTWIDSDVAKNNPDTIILPEMWTTAYTLEDLQELSDVNGEPTLSFLKEQATKHDINIIGGSIANKNDGQIFNTTYVIDRKGQLVYEYNKAHLVPMLQEHHYLTGGGKPPEIFELDGLKFGAIICYDLRFPELIRPLAIEGAQVLVVVAEWPLARRDHWRNLLISRAIENQMFVLSANRVGSYDGVEFSGTSMGIDPWGNILFEGSKNHEQTISTSLEISKVDQVRKDVPIFSSRVPHIYKNNQ